MKNNNPMYATEDAVWLDVFGVIKDSVSRDPKLIFKLEKFTDTLKSNYLKEHDGKYPK